MIWALDRLARAGAIAPPADFSPVVAELEARNTALTAPWGHGTDGLLMGNSGIRLLHYRQSVDRGATDTAAAIADALAAGVAANTDHPSLELLWGSPGTMHAALTMHEWTGEARWAELFRADADALWRAFLPADEAPCRLWTQPLWGRKQKMTGAGHGFAGNASAVIRGRALLPAAAWAQWADAIIETAHATALRDGPLANWVPEVPPAHTPPKMLVQWCHGAPGMVTSLAGLPDPRLDELLAAAAELTWVAGPLAKGRGVVPRDGRQWLCVAEAVQAQRRPALAGTRARVRDARDGAVRPHGRGTWPAPPLAVDRRRRRCLLCLELHRRRRRTAQPRPIH